ncbi:hypothetical protein PPL_08443 [Heterostelium album PN500]|uniref:F-box domain-containing protein n=1 Tax=Heterostelium pallidum (strain ATCC 26659 / Pp 5 / PN500) TaxID=670386 RepID=D3BI75_HETP5|nr:hypothetical protein PPL_08443 [Heterostelium album PN500]EFA78975.1 hypothetical protein PPL_08443 [Heterostelium album PN500]|eukprot:XP_020431099.1 hypothetical protein PPL_08443 [Heterostelium album PN500]
MIVNLSHLLLLKIVSYLEDNIDRICVSLVCKRFFDERDKYLYFNTDNIGMNNIQVEEDKDDEIYNHKNVFTLKSYRSSILRSLNQKKEIYKMISNSNVSTLKGISSLSCISAGVLPNTLKKLKFGSNFNQALEPHVLPSSLTHLQLGRDYAQTLQVGSLPPNLRVLINNGNCVISDGVLPQSLCTLKSPFSWIPFIKSLDNLTTLTLTQFGCSESKINLSDLPASLTSLDIHGSCHLTSTLSPSIKYLNIFETQYDIDEIFKDRSQYHFERISVDGFKQESLDNLKIKELQLQLDKIENIIRDIPFGVETLYFGHDEYQLSKNIPNGIPSSVKKIIFQYYKTINEIDFEIPNTVEEIVIQRYCNSDQFSSKWIPNSVKSMTIPSEWIRDNIETPISVTNFCFISYNQKVDLHVRKIYDNHYLLFGQSRDKFSAAVVSRILSKFIDK